MTGIAAWTRKRGSVIYLTVLIFAATGGAYYLGFHNAATVTQLCQAGNESRAQQVKLWTHFAAISKPPPHETPAQAAARKRQVNSILAYIHHIFAPRDCQAIRR